MKSCTVCEVIPGGTSMRWNFKHNQLLSKLSPFKRAICVQIDLIYWNSEIYVGT